MQLTAVEIAGFKSFAGRTLFPIPAGLTAMVGANGTGKSNFSEAIRWVLGEQSPKIVRSQRAEDVIFAGTPAVRRAGRALVAVTFANHSRRLNVDTPQVTIARLTSRIGESEYTVNGDPVRLFDVQHLLAQAGIGSKSYAVISQGMVDYYITARPAARRELFDEATGIRPLQLKITRATHTLAQTDGHALALAQHVAELMPRVTVLKHAYEQAQKRAALTSRFHQAQDAWLANEWRTRRAAIEAAKERLSRATAAVAQARATRARLEAAWHQAARRANPHDQITAELAHATAEWERAQAEYERVGHERQALQQSLKTLAVKRQQAKRALYSAQAKVKDVPWFARMRTLLDRCAALLVAYQRRGVADPDQLTTVQRELKRARGDLTGELAALPVAQAIMQVLGKPLQDMARLEATTKEREAALAARPPRRAPTRERIERLQAQLAHRQSDTPSPPQAGLERARAAELAAAQEVARAEDEQRRAETADGAMLTEIRRERGESYLNSLPHHPPVEPVTEEVVRRLAAQLTAIGEPDPLAVKEYEEAAARLTYLTQQQADVERARRNTQQLLAQLTDTMNRQFRQQFAAIQIAFGRSFRRLFGGGEAALMLVEAQENDAELESRTAPRGIEMMAHPPGKRLRHLHLLSGGEKALTALALLWAIIEVQQPPFLVLDEVDAALDEANSERFAALLKETSQRTQCIVITHNRAVMGQADTLYGVAMGTDGVSRVYSLRLADLAPVAVRS